MKIYCGLINEKDHSQKKVVVFFPRGKEGKGAGKYDLKPRLDLANHSPTGLTWGYAGSGPAQLSLALLADALGDDEQAMKAYQQYKFAVIANLPQDKGWELSQKEIINVVARLQEATQRV